MDLWKHKNLRGKHKKKKKKKVDNLEAEAEQRRNIHNPLPHYTMTDKFQVWNFKTLKKKKMTFVYRRKCREDLLWELTASPEEA